MANPRPISHGCRRTKVSSKIGFIGLGVMGAPMAANLIRAGHSVRGYDVVPSARAKAELAGAPIARSPADATHDAEYMITLLPTAENVAEAICDPDAALRAMRAGAAPIDMSTIRPSVSQEMSRFAAEAGIGMLDAPVSRGQAAAIKGDLLIMVGGDEALYQRCCGILSVLGSNIIYVGGSGMGAVAKLVNNILVGCICAATSEALVFGTKAGAELERLVEVLTNASGNNWLLQNQMQPALHGSFEPGFFADHMYKDLGLALASAKELGVSLKMADVAEDLFNGVRAHGLGKRDYTVILKLMEEAAGVKVRYRDALETPHTSPRRFHN